MLNQRGEKISNRPLKASRVWLLLKSLTSTTLDSIAGAEDTFGKGLGETKCICNLTTAVIIPSLRNQKQRCHFLHQQFLYEACEGGFLMRNLDGNI